MSIGQKLASLRKENNLTQEQFAEKLNVTRQSVSKWEQDLAYPETDKLVQISKMFNCSLDYLLIDENLKNENNNQEEEAKKEIKFYQRRTFFTSCWTVSFFILNLIFFLFPYINARINLGYLEGYKNFNLYNLLGASNYQFGNFLVLLAFLVLLSELVIGIFIYFEVNMNKLGKVRIITAFTQSGIWFILLIFLINSFAIGMILILLLSLCNSLGLLFIKNNLIYKE